MEFCEGGELFGRSITVNDDNIAFIAKKLINAINYCHSNNIVLIFLFIYIIRLIEILNLKMFYTLLKIKILILN